MKCILGYLSYEAKLVSVSLDCRNVSFFLSLVSDRFKDVVLNKSQMNS